MDVGSWLRSLGLAQYEAAFKDNAVDAEVLFELSDSDLAQLGVLLGHQKRLLKAIAELAPPSRHASRSADRAGRYSGVPRSKFPGRVNLRNESAADVDAFDLNNAVSRTNLSLVEATI
jgi:hypothetical protein